MLKWALRHSMREQKTLYVDHDDNLIEELDEESFEKFCEENEIEIDDLIEER